MGIMTHSHLRHLPVVEKGQLLGLLSIGDLIKEAIAAQADLILQLEQYIRGEWTLGAASAQLHGMHTDHRP
ncbi:hypothetical protein D3C75_1357980 [compost metagenome]